MFEAQTHCLKAGTTPPPEVKHRVWGPAKSLKAIGGSVHECMTHDIDTSVWLHDICHFRLRLMCAIAGEDCMIFFAWYLVLCAIISEVPNFIFCVMCWWDMMNRSWRVRWLRLDDEGCMTKVDEWLRLYDMWDSPTYPFRETILSWSGLSVLAYNLGGKNLAWRNIFFIETKQMIITCLRTPDVEVQHVGVISCGTRVRRLMNAAKWS